MNFIIDVVKYLIDNGEKSVTWNENGSTEYSWEISNGKCSLEFCADVNEYGKRTYSLYLYEDAEVINSLFDFAPDTTLTLERFKEKLFEKANTVELVLDGLTKISTYLVAYEEPELGVGIEFLYSAGKFKSFGAELKTPETYKLITLDENTKNPHGKLNVWLKAVERSGVLG